MGEEVRDKEQYIERSIDPSQLTTQMVWREIGSLKELIQAELSAVKKGIEVAHDDLVRVPTEVQKVTSSLEQLMQTKINYEHKIADLQIQFLEKQFTWLEKFRAEQNASNILSTSKSEISFTKQVDQLTGLVHTINSNLGDKIGEVKERFNISDSAIKSKAEGVKDFRDWIPWIITIIMFLYFIYNQNK